VSDDYIVARVDVPSEVQTNNRVRDGDWTLGSAE